MNQITSTIENVNNAVNGFVWGLPMLILLVGTGILMTLLTKVFQITHFRHWIKNTVGGIFTDKHVTKHTEKHDKQISQQPPSVPAISPAWRPPSYPAVRERFFGCGSWPSLE